MSTIQEIEAAIQSLPPKEREKLIKDLPSILPELDGDAEWDRLISDRSPRPALTELGDEIEAKMKVNPAQFPEMVEKDFEQPS
jgi:uncharacterized protein (DUF2249 family)